MSSDKPFHQKHPSCSVKFEGLYQAIIDNNIKDFNQHLVTLLNSKDINHEWLKMSTNEIHSELREQTDFFNAQYFSFRLDKSGENDLRFAFFSWRIISEIGLLNTVMNEFQQSSSRESPTFDLFFESSRYFLESFSSIIKCNLHSIHNSSPSPGIYRLNFELDANIDWKIENIETIKLENDDDDDHDDDKTRKEFRNRLSPVTYIEAEEYSYYDDSSTTFYTSGLLTLAKDREALDSFLSHQRSIESLNCFLQSARLHTPSMIDIIDSGMPVDIEKHISRYSIRAITAAAEQFNTHSIDELLSLGASPNRQPNEVYSPIGAIIKNVRFFQYGHANLENINVDGIACIEKFLSAGADINEAASVFTGDTALNLACYAGNTELAAFLLRHGANPNIQNGSCNDTFDLARKFDNKNLLALLDGWRANEAIGQLLVTNVAPKCAHSI